MSDTSILLAMPTMNLAAVLVWAAILYGAAGVLFAVPFLTAGVMSIDPTAAGSNVWFRLIIAPGVIALWPLLLNRWAGHVNEPVERNAHRIAAQKGSG